MRPRVGRLAAAVSVGLVAVVMGVVGLPGAFAQDDHPGGHDMPPEEPYNPLDPIVDHAVAVIRGAPLDHGQPPPPR